MVADLVTGVYLRPEGEDYIVGYDGNGEWSTDNLDPNCNSWNEVWEHLYHRFPNVFDAAKMEGFFSSCSRKKCFLKSGLPVWFNFKFHFLHKTNPGKTLPFKNA